MGDLKAFRNRDSLLSQLQDIGEDRARKLLVEIASGTGKATPRDFASDLGRLSLHYWRPDFSPDQARVLYSDFIRLLDGLTADELRQACDDWLMDPENRFFPTPGQLKDLVQYKITARIKRQRGAEYLFELLKPAGERRSEVSAMIDDVAAKMSAKRA